MIPPEVGAQACLEAKLFSENDLGKNVIKNNNNVNQSINNILNKHTFQTGILIIWPLEKNRRENLTILASESLKTDTSASSCDTFRF